MSTMQAAPSGLDQTLMTREGYDRLRTELALLTGAARRELAERLREARGHGGDPSENGELMDALEESEQLERRIAELEMRLAGVRVAAPARAGGEAVVGTMVRLRASSGATVEYALVGAGEADPAHGRISIASPMGQAVAGRRPGDPVEVQTPTRVVRLELISVEPLGASMREAA